MNDKFPPPSHLSEKSKALWRAVVPKRARSPGRLAIVLMALESLDRADSAMTEVDKAGMTTVTKTTGAVHLHPLLRVERENRQLFSKTWRDLGFEYSPEVDPIWSVFRSEYSHGEDSHKV